MVKTRGYGAHERWGPTGWFTDRELAGGGALLDMGVHAIDTARFLLGDPEPGRVCATVGTRYAEGRYEVDDDAILLIGWDNGTNSVVESGWWQPRIGGLEADTEVYGTKGYQRIWPDTPPAEDYEHCTQPMYSAQMAEFLDSVAEGRQPRPSGEDGRIVMQIVEARLRERSRRGLRTALSRISWPWHKGSVRSHERLRRWSMVILVMVGMTAVPAASASPTPEGVPDLAIAGPVVASMARTSSHRNPMPARRFRLRARAGPPGSPSPSATSVPATTRSTSAERETAMASWFGITTIALSR